MNSHLHNQIYHHYSHNLIKIAFALSIAKNLHEFKSLCLRTSSLFLGARSALSLSVPHKELMSLHLPS